MLGYSFMAGARDLSGYLVAHAVQMSFVQKKIQKITFSCPGEPQSATFVPVTHEASLAENEKGMYLLGETDFTFMLFGHVYKNKTDLCARQQKGDERHGGKKKGTAIPPLTCKSKEKPAQGCKEAPGTTITLSGRRKRFMMDACRAPGRYLDRMEEDAAKKIPTVTSSPGGRGPGGKEGHPHLRLTTAKKKWQNIATPWGVVSQ